mmetsp:Transcript_137275/g.238735  ORF Transcript_137275/g.238735 Transcript_137275/m.238735 type:complete len:269 (-) Transcript_137275:68-874(-)
MKFFSEAKKKVPAATIGGALTNIVTGMDPEAKGSSHYMEYRLLELSSSSMYSSMFQALHDYLRDCRTRLEKVVVCSGDAQVLIRAVYYLWAKGFDVTHLLPRFADEERTEPLEKLKKFRMAPQCTALLVPMTELHSYTVDLPEVGHLVCVGAFGVTKKVMDAICPTTWMEPLQRARPRQKVVVLVHDLPTHRLHAHALAHRFDLPSDWLKELTRPKTGEEMADAENGKDSLLRVLEGYRGVKLPRGTVGITPPSYRRHDWWSAAPHGQ